MEFEQYMTDSMRTLYGGHSLAKDVEASIIHCPIEEEHPSQWDHDFYMAHLDILGKIREGKYNSINVYGFRLDRVIEFMKDNGFELHGIRQFCRTDDVPRISIAFCLDEK